MLYDMWGYILDVTTSSGPLRTTLHDDYNPAREAFIAAVSDKHTTSATLLRITEKRPTDARVRPKGQPVCSYESVEAERLAREQAEPS